MRKKVGILLITISLLLLSFGGIFIFARKENKTTQTQTNPLAIRCQGDSCDQSSSGEVKGAEDNKTTKTTKNTTSTTTTSTQVNTTTTSVNTTSNINNNVNTPKTTVKTTTISTTVVEYRYYNSSEINNDGQGGDSTLDNNSSDVNNSIVFNETNDPVIAGRDNYQQWEAHSTFKLVEPNEKLYPGKGGTYEFFIDNISDDEVEYMITFNETNEARANILYKLKRNNEYISGNDDTWVHYNDMDFTNRILEKEETDSYILEWKWVDAPNDTEVGRTPNATYTFGMHVVAYEEREDNPEYDGKGGEVKGVETDIWSNPKTGDNIYLYIILLFSSIVSLILIKRYRGN